MHRLLPTTYSYSRDEQIERPLPVPMINLLLLLPLLGSSLLFLSSLLDILNNHLWHGHLWLTVFRDLTLDLLLIMLSLCLFSLTLALIDNDHRALILHVVDDSAEAPFNAPKVPIAIEAICVGRPVSRDPWGL